MNFGQSRFFYPVPSLLNADTGLTYIKCTLEPGAKADSLPTFFELAILLNIDSCSRLLNLAHWKLRRAQRLETAQDTGFVVAVSSTDRTLWALWNTGNGQASGSLPGCNNIDALLSSGQDPPKALYINPSKFVSSASRSSMAAWIKVCGWSLFMLPRPLLYKAATISPQTIDKKLVGNLGVSRNPVERWVTW